jgi:hypothetical protein
VIRLGHSGKKYIFLQFIEINGLLHICYIEIKNKRGKPAEA